MKKEEVESRTVFLYTFGSYEMGVHFPTTDMDTIAVFPSYIYQEDFFTHFKARLTEVKDAEDIIDVVDARIPILKFKFQGIQIDMLYAAADPKIMEQNQPFNKLINDE